MSSGREELRAELMKRRVPFKAYSVKLYDVLMEVGTVYSGNGISWVAIENPDTHRISVSNFKDELTPAQVIAATLGAVRLEKAKAKRMPNHWGFSDYYCGCCGHKLTSVANGLNEHFPNYCEECGTKAVYE